MKTYNKHPKWFDKPMRLTKEQRKDPISLFDEFFKSYHLDEVREILWTWMKEAVSTDSGFMNAIERKNQIFFYEKVEELVEAVFVLRMNAKKVAKRKRRKQKMNHG
jgi:hypothetical protein